MKKITQFDHPVLQHKLAILRSKDSPASVFRSVLKEISSLLAYEVTQDLPLENRDVETPLASTQAKHIAEKIIIASILRAGEGMLDGFLQTLPFAHVGHIGIYRDKEMNSTIEYYFRLPEDVKEKTILVLDPLLATGDTALAAIHRLKEYEVGTIKLITVLASQEGIKKIHTHHPDVEIATLSVEETLNEQGYVLPGIGDAGNRLYRTHE